MARFAVLALLLSLPSASAAAECSALRTYDSDNLSECTDEGDLARVQLLQHEFMVGKGLSLGQTAAGMKSTTSTTLPPTGLTMNAAGDLTTLITSVILYYGATFFFVCFFCVMRLRYPIVYSNNVLEGIAPTKPLETYFGWFKPTMALTIDQISEHITLDHAMLIEFSHFGMKVMATIGIPMIIIEGSLNWSCGGLAAGEDHLSYLSFGNVEDGSWLYWLHCFIVWCVVMYVTRATHQAMRDFLPRRVKWLEEMAEIRSKTVLVEGVPEDCRTEAKVRETFMGLLPRPQVTKVEFVKDTTLLSSLVNQYKNAVYHVQVAEAEAVKHPDHPPMVRESFMGSKVEAIPYWKKQVQELEPQVKQERKRILDEANVVEGVNLSNVFVTFADQGSAELALKLSSNITFDQDEWVILTAPQPFDILWADLTQDDTAKGVREVFGYMLVVLLYFLYMPMVIGVTNLGKAVELKYIGLGALQSAWDGVAPTLGLQFIVAFLPTFLILIFQNFFTLRAEVLQQHKLQIWYFWFQFVFVILATAIGQNFMEFAKTLFTDPMNLIPVLANTMPYATHYYMNYLVLQCFSHGMNATRYIPWIKYKGFMGIFDEKDAKRMSEPEDQDYYGMGSRSARWTIMLGIGIVFGTLSPPINLFAFIVFFVCRVIYGYLVVFAETVKSDSGGYFWVTSLEQMFPLLMLYVLMMAGVFYQRSTSVAPCVIAASSLVWIFASLRKFKHYSWESLPMQDLHAAKLIKKRPSKGQYVQPELLEDKA